MNQISTNWSVHYQAFCSSSVRYDDYFLIHILSYIYQILSKTANNAVMETVDPEITVTSKDLGAVKKAFQLALLCTKRQPSDRPTMHEVTRVIGSLLPSAAPLKPIPSVASLPPSAGVPSYKDEYAKLKTPHVLNCPSMSTSDAQLFLKFGEVISQNSE